MTSTSHHCDSCYNCTMWHPSIIILVFVLLSIMLRKLSPMHVPIWVIMLLGATAALITQQITLRAAWYAIDWNIIGYLIGVFILGQALEESGYLMRLGRFLLTLAHRPFALILMIFISQGIASAFLMNDTMAIIMTPLLLNIAKHNRVLPKVLLLSLAYAITIGSVMSPIGNPQNLLIALHGQLAQPFVTFFATLALPTLLNLLIGTLWIYACFHQQLRQHQINVEAFNVANPSSLTNVCKLSICLFIIAILLKTITTALHSSFNLPFYTIATIAAAPILLFSQQRLNILKNTDWATIIFFIALFILMQSVWNSHVLQQALQQTHLPLQHTSSILIISALVSQLISNVPLVALYLPLLMQHGPISHHALMALAAGSTIAGNLLIIGAASNIIIIQKAEKMGYHGIGFFDFAKVGLPLAIFNLILYYLFL